MKLHIVTGHDDAGLNPVALYVGDDGEKALQVYHKAREAAEFPKIGYVRNAIFSKRCTTEVKGATEPEAEKPPAPKGKN
jgi:hypothetical protein